MFICRRNLERFIQSECSNGNTVIHSVSLLRNRKISELRHILAPRRLKAGTLLIVSLRKLFIEPSHKCYGLLFLQLEEEQITSICLGGILFYSFSQSVYRDIMTSSCVRAQQVSRVFMFYQSFSDISKKTNFKKRFYIATLYL